jgi:hypothetical protein
MTRNDGEEVRSADEEETTSTLLLIPEIKIHSKKCLCEVL